MIKYSNTECLKFIDDMADVGLEISHYRGRNFWEGPAVYVDDIQDCLSNTKVKCQWDNLGKGYIVYPKASDKGA